MAKFSRQMLHSLWATPPSLLAGLFVGRSCEAFSVYVTRRKSDLMLGPAAGHMLLETELSYKGICPAIKQDYQLVVLVQLHNHKL